ncbi:DMT family transporter [Shimia abyssi]|uniref:Drug/metabolite transporter (DMT)-like permease n=1 Tax=Shimia abyssi TaxID=1662395 RepID=A0A2P8F6T8_9RHOB|nr:DMT family transporter [Shimia abyssi]PSL17431.1 drug/metabolite transporter (DMT)-like permease [Shimia abyssi]
MNNLYGILLIVAAMVGFSIEDIFIKQLSDPLPTGQILLVLGLGSCIIFGGLAIFNRQNIFARAAWTPMMLVRALADGIAAMFFASALGRVDLSTVAAVFQTLPLVITLGAALFLGEQVGWRRWSAIAVGFCGVLLIIRPGSIAFDPNTLLVLGAVITIAIRDLITRRIDITVSSSVVSFQGFASLAVAGIVLLYATSRPPAPIGTSEAAMFAAAILFGAAAYWGIVTAMRIGEASVVAPYRYTRLLFSIVGGMLVFGERPDMLMLAGATLIIGSGLYTFLRERIRAETPA